jgi:NAD(P)-dependent dehydrogenase (short-subunit alcohol dehydrogenase family)
VTGASSGIGRATALALARRGFDLGLGYSSGTAGITATAAAVDAIRGGGASKVFRLDLSEPIDAAAAVERVADELGRIDVLVNAAGINRRAPAVSESLAAWNRVLAVNLSGPFACAQVAARRMIEQGDGGRIVNVSSIHDAVPLVGGASYCAAKGGLAMLTRVLALELAEHGITVNAVSPGETATRMNGVPEGVDAADLARPAIPVGRPGRADEIAAAIVFLTSSEAAYLTGSTITIDGGLTLTSAVANQRHAGVVNGYCDEKSAADQDPPTKSNR